MLAPFVLWCQQQKQEGVSVAAAGVGEGLGVQPLRQEQNASQKLSSGLVRVSEAREGVSVPAPRVGTRVTIPCAWYHL